MTKQKATTSTYQSQNTTNEEERYAHNMIGFAAVLAQINPRLSLLCNVFAHPNFSISSLSAKAPTRGTGLSAYTCSSIVLKKR